LPPNQSRQFRDARVPRGKIPAPFVRRQVGRQLRMGAGDTMLYTHAPHDPVITTKKITMVKMSDAGV
jgi:hypothetical protein